MQIFLRVLLIFIFFCSAFFIKPNSFEFNKNIPGSFSYISKTKQETELSVKQEEYFTVSSNQNKTEIRNQINRNSHLGMSFGCTIYNQLNIFNKFVIYKNKLSFRYVLYKVLNNLRNSIYTRAP